MTFNEYKEHLENELEKLNGFDLKPFLLNKTDITDIMDNIEKELPFQFYYVGVEDFRDYLTERYNVVFIVCHILYRKEDEICEKPMKNLIS